MAQLRTFTNTSPAVGEGAAISSSRSGELAIEAVLERSIALISTDPVIPRPQSSEIPDFDLTRS
jgi:hypothetical protein